VRPPKFPVILQIKLKVSFPRGGSLSFLVGTISNVLVMEIGWTDVGSGGYILVSCAHSNTSFNHRYAADKISKHSEKHYSSYHTT
jgi:hypothetical protein